MASAVFIATFISAAFRWVYVPLFLFYMNHNFLENMKKNSHCKMQVAFRNSHNNDIIHNNFLLTPFFVSFSFPLHYFSMSVPPFRCSRSMVQSVHRPMSLQGGSHRTKM